MNSLEQGTLIYINFDPSRGSEIKKEDLQLSLAVMNTL